MLLKFQIKRLKFNFKKHFIYLYNFNLIHNLILIKNIFDYNFNIEIVINYFYARNNNIYI